MASEEQWVVYRIDECDHVGVVTDEDFDDMMDGDAMSMMAMPQGDFDNFKDADIFAKSLAKRLNYEYKGE